VRLGAVLLSVFCAIAACTPGTEDPSLIKDLRVVSLTFDPPDVLIAGCDPRLVQAALGGQGGTPNINPNDPAVQALLRAFSTPIDFSALVLDPAGAGRSLNYQLLACSSTGDRQCDDANEYIEISKGSVTSGEELTVKTTLGLTQLSNQRLLLFEVVQNDRFRGLGGIRMPVVLRVQPEDGSEQVFAQKLMVYTCPAFPEQKQNVQPKLPGLKLDGTDWLLGEVREVKSGQALNVEPLDFSSLEEKYIVPSLELQPVQLQEAWKTSWLSTTGIISPNETGGVDVAGQASRSRVKWTPNLLSGESADAVFYAVARDGRGGQTYLERKVRVVK
jgi:hypothetical protein